MKSFFAALSKKNCSGKRDPALWRGNPIIFLTGFIAVVIPFPVPYFGHVFAMGFDIGFVFEEFVADVLFGVSAPRAEVRQAVYDIAREMKAVEVVHHHYVEGSGGGAFFFVAAHVQVFVVGSAIGETMDEQGIAVKSKNDLFVVGEEGIEIGIA